MHMLLRIITIGRPAYVIALVTQLTILYQHRTRQHLLIYFLRYQDPSFDARIDRGAIFVPRDVGGWIGFARGVAGQVDALRFLDEFLAVYEDSCGYNRIYTYYVELLYMYFQCLDKNVRISSCNIRIT